MLIVAVKKVLTHHLETSVHVVVAYTHKYCCQCRKNTLIKHNYFKWTHQIHFLQHKIFCVNFKYIPVAEKSPFIFILMQYKNKDFDS